MELPTFFKKSSPSLSRRFNFSVPATASFKCSCTPATGDDRKNMEERCGKFSAKSTFSEAPTGEKNNPLERHANGPLAPSSGSSSSFSTGAGSAIAKPGAPGRSLIHGGIPGHPNGHPLVGPLGVSNLMGLINLHPPFFIWLHDSMIPFGTYDTHPGLHKAGMSHRSCDGQSRKWHLLQRLRTAKEHSLPARHGPKKTGHQQQPPLPLRHLQSQRWSQSQAPMSHWQELPRLTSAARPKQAKKTGLHAPNTMPLGRDWRKKFTQQIDEEANK